MNKKLIDQIEKTNVNGIITTKDITSMGIHRSVLQELVKKGKYYKVQRGVYLKKDEWEDEFFLLAKKYNKGIFSHNTALYLHGYTDRVPMKLDMTFPKGYNCSSFRNSNINITRVIDDNYTIGIRDIKTPMGNTVKAYDIERSICDMLRGNNNDLQTIQSSMKKYISSKEKDINKLMKYAKKLHVEAKVKRYVEILL